MEPYRLGIVRYSTRFPTQDQRDTLKAFGVDKILEIGKDIADSKTLARMLRRPGDQVCVVGLHRLAPTWPLLETALEHIAERGAVVVDARDGAVADAVNSARLIAEARRVYSGETRPPMSSEDARRYGRLGGKPPIELGKAHQAMWRDGRFATNRDAAAAISNVVGYSVAVRTLQRRFGPSGRMAGFPAVARV